MLALEEPPSVDEGRRDKQTSSKQCRGAMTGAYQGYDFTVGTGEKRVMTREDTEVQATCEGRHISHIDTHMHTLSA